MKSSIIHVAKVYFVTIPEHKFLHIRNYESIGYWDFWQKQSQIPGQDCDRFWKYVRPVKKYNSI